MISIRNTLPNLDLKQKRMLFLIGSVLVVIILAFMIASLLTRPQSPGLNTLYGNIPTPIPATSQSKNAPTSVLSLKKQSDTSIAVLLDTGNKVVSAAQIELSYDTQVLTNVTVTPGTFFDNSLTLINTVDPKTGTIFFASAVSPYGKQKTGKGILGIINFTVLPGITNQTSFSFLPRTKITSEGIDVSVLKDTKDITIPITSQ